jgi:WD40 repeat protein/serine/threonine protein kinase
LRRRVEALLLAHDRAGAFLEEPVTGAPLAPAMNAPQDPGAPAGSSAPLVEKRGDRIGRYKLLQQIGEGGCGVVHMAEQEEPVRRRVALKIVKLGMDTRQVIGRFEAERQALALMDHPNIAKVLDAGATETGRPFFVMELVRGAAITSYCDQNNLPTRDRLGLFIKVCQAIQHAHQKGIIHRDVKPSNILVTVNDGVPVPKVIDFGIAKATEGRLTDQTLFTAFEQFLGTPAYMSPEQSVLTSVDIDTRSDIYSLGVLLYELLTGRPPFDQKELLATGLDEMRRIIREKEPWPPSTRLSEMLDSDLLEVARRRQSEPPRLIHLVRGDLDWIVMKCLEKDRARRYETANGLAMDVRRFLDSEPIVARPPRKLYRFQKLVRRNKLVFAAGGAVAAALVIGLGLTTWQFLEKSKAEREQSRLRQEAQRAQASEARARHQAEAQELSARKKAYASDMKLLQQTLAADDLGRAQELLNGQRPRPGQQDLRGWEWRYLWQFCQSDAAFTLCQRSNAIVSVSFSADGSLLAVGTWDTEITVWDIAARSMIFHREARPGSTAKLAFARTGNILAYCDVVNQDRFVLLWDSRTRMETHRLPLNEGLRDLAFTQDGRLFTCEWNGSNTVAVWDVKSGLNLARFTARAPAYAMGTIFSATEDGTSFAHVVFGAPRLVRIAGTDGSSDSRFPVSDELTTALAFSKDGRTLITGGGYAEGAVKLWDVATRQPAGKLDGHRSWVSCLKLLPDGKTLASASADRTVRLWDITTREPIRTFRGQGGELWSIDVSADGRWLAGGSKDGSVVFWDLSSSTNRPPAYRTLRQDGAWWGASYSPDGKWFGLLQNWKLTLYDAKTLQPTIEPPFAISNVVSFVLSPDMRLLVAMDGKLRLNVLEMPGLGVITNLDVHSNVISALSPVFLSGGRNLLTYSTDRMYRLWDVATWRQIRSWEMDVDKNFRAVSPETGLIAAANGRGWIQLIPAQDPERSRQVRGEDRLVSVALSPDGKTLAAASENGTVELWDTEAGTRVALLHGVLLGYHSVAISPDGERVAAGSNGQEAIKIWDLHSHEEVATLSGQGSSFSDLKFSPDGNTISARNWNGVIHFWTAPSWQEIEEAEKTRSLGPP